MFKVSCSKGTYIRSLCEDIAKRLGTLGFMSKLERLQVGEFTIEKSITLDELDENKDNVKFLNEHFITIEKLFENNKKIMLNDRKLELFLNGVKLTENLEDGIYKVYNNDKFIGIGIVKDKLLKRDIVTNV